MPILTDLLRFTGYCLLLLLGADFEDDDDAGAIIGPGEDALGPMFNDMTAEWDTESSGRITKW